ncbi:hypothetical protein D3C78_730970 [compost metagenome]
MQNATATPGVAGDSDDNDQSGALPAVFSAIVGTLIGWARSSAAVVTPTSAYGTDGAGTTGLSLKVDGFTAGTGVLSNLQITDGTAIYLYEEGGLVVGRVGATESAADTGPVAFAISIDSSGFLSTAQYLALKHPTFPSSHDEAVSLTATLVKAVLTVTDGDLDVDSAEQNVGDRVRFEDDGPDATLTLGTASVTHDETAGVQNATATPGVAGDSDDNDQSGALPAVFSAIVGTLIGWARSSAAVVTPTSAYGTDGAGTTGLSLKVDGFTAGTGVLSNLQITDGTAIYLYEEGGLVVGRVGATESAADTGPVAFAISIDSSGFLSTAQYLALKHPTFPSSHDEAVSLTATLVKAVLTVTDGDLDVDTAEQNVGDRVRFEDDGPSLAFGNLIGTGTILPQYGYWNRSAGTDGLGTTGLDIALVNGQFTLVRPDGTTATGTGTLTEQSPSPDGEGAYQFAGTLTGDFDNNPATANTSIDYTLTAFADGTYALDLVQGFGSTVVLSSADGSLDAGGPDPVRTLLIPETDDPAIPSLSEEIVFFGVEATATTANIIEAIGQEEGEGNLTEAEVEAGGFAFIADENMNVSTSGIGIGNNNLEGNTTAGINAGDESFVINPETLLTGMKVFIDNSVSGYNPATEELYYRIFYADGSTSDQIKVLAADLQSAPDAEYGLGVGVVFFEIAREGTKMIDAVQLTMGLGTIKVPVIEFIQETENLASDIQLTFSATLTDGDGDTATSTFDANLFANEVAADALFDYSLVGTGGERDAFNIDLEAEENLYQVTGFDANASPGLRDTLVLIGDPNVQATDISIDNNGADSIVTIDESGGQITTITVVGVDLLAGDIVIA